MRHVVERNPLSEQVSLILLSIANEPKHGYLLLKDVEQMSAGRLRLSTGTLYGAIHRMLEDGWIASCDCPDGSRDKRCYKVTREGRNVLAGEHERLVRLAKLFQTTMKAREV